jgi:hypothetical protein
MSIKLKLINNERKPKQMSVLHPWKVHRGYTAIAYTACTVLLTLVQYVSTGYTLQANRISKNLDKNYV